MDNAKNVYLQWKHHHSNLQTMLLQQLHRGDFCDVTLACEGQTLMAHRMILCASSTYFDSILSKASSYKETIIVLRDFNFADLKCLIEYMYKGEVVVETGQLESLLKAAKDLRIKGLGAETETGISKGADDEKNSSDNSSVHDENDRSCNKKRTLPQSDCVRSAKIPRIVSVQTASTSAMAVPYPHTEKVKEEGFMQDTLPKTEPNCTPSAFDENNQQHLLEHSEEINPVENVESSVYEQSNDDPANVYGTSSASVVFNIYDVEPITDLTDEISSESTHLRHDARAAALNSDESLLLHKSIDALCYCSLNCLARISAERQREINASFKRLKKNTAKVAFLRDNFEEVKHENRRDRSLTRLYYLNDEHGTRRRVCRQFFLSILQISGSTMARALASAE